MRIVFGFGFGFVSELVVGSAPSRGDRDAQTAPARLPVALENAPNAPRARAPVELLLRRVARDRRRVDVAQHAPVGVHHLGRLVQAEVQLDDLLQRLEAPVYLVGVDGVGVVV